VPRLFHDIPFFVTVFLKVAGIIVRIDSRVAWQRFRDAGFYKDFIVARASRYDCRLQHTIGPSPKFEPDSAPFCTQNWQLASANGSRVLRIGPAPKKGSADNIVVFSPDYREGAMYQKSVFEIFRRFIDQFLFINLLSKKRGFLLHASGLIWKGKVICFSGVSGTGKSTLLELFRDEVPRSQLLNDDRLALRPYGGDWRVFGTPWYGESRVSSPASAKLSALFFIRHSPRNYVRRLAPSDICPRLLTLALLPLWDEEAASRVLSAFQTIIRDIPIFELGFLPDKSAVELIKKSV
jgi:hypothetical protein